MSGKRQRHSLSEEVCKTCICKTSIRKTWLPLFHCSLTGRLIAESHGHHSVVRNGCRFMPINAHV